MPRCDPEEDETSVKSCEGINEKCCRTTGKCITKKGVTEDFVPPPKVLEHFDCPACSEYSEDSDSYSSSDDDDEDGAGGGGAGRGRRRGRRGRGSRGRGSSRSRSRGRGGRRGRRGRGGGYDDDDEYGVGGRGGRRGGGGKGADGRGGRGSADEKRAARLAKRDAARYQPWTPYYISTVMLEKLAALVALFMYVYTDNYRWGLVKSFAFFTFSVKSAFHLADIVQAECQRRQDCIDLHAKYSK